MGAIEQDFRTRTFVAYAVAITLWIAAAVFAALEVHRREPPWIASLFVATGAVAWMAARKRHRIWNEAHGALL